MSCNHTHIDNVAFWDRGFDYPPANFASRRVSQHLGLRTPVVFVCAKHTRVRYRAYEHDKMTAIWVLQNSETATMLMHQANPV